MSRSFSRRREDRAERLFRRAEYLQQRISRTDGVRRDLDTAECSALLWALEEIERLNVIESALEDRTLSEGAKLIAIGSVCESRYAPTYADLQRTKQLARQYGWETQSEDDADD